MSQAVTKLAVLLVSLPVALVVVGAPGCGSDPPRKVIEASLFASGYAQALCASLKHCCDENIVAYNEAECTKGWKADIERRFFAAPDINYDARAANDCIVKIQAAQSALCEPTKGSVADARDLCVRIFVGQKPLGAPCVTASECAIPPAGRVVCDQTPGGPRDGGTLPLTLGILAAPVCTLVSAPAPGEPCALAAGQVGVTNCGAELFCDPATLQCRVRSQQGSPCIPGGCAAGAYCAKVGGGDGTACASFAPLGAACNSLEQCDATSRCDVTGSKTCVPKKQPGDPCTDDVECQIGSCDATTKRCLKNAFATTAACTGQGY